MCDPAEVVSGSFRDPSGFVFLQDRILYRHVNECYRPHYDRLVQSGLASHLIDRSLLIRHDEVSVTHSVQRDAYRVLRPERVPFVSYPYEWSFSQLRDAALLTLDVQTAALTFGMSLKDASAYNVQFLRGKPILIDTLSFELAEEGRPWVAYRQFCQHFLAPLALMAHRDVRLAQLLRVFVDGVPLDLASGLLPAGTRLRPSLAMHLHLHARAQRRYAGRAAPSAPHRRLNRTALLAILESLAAAVRSLRPSAARTQWSEYYRDTNYTAPAFAEKEQFVARGLDVVRPAIVWDLGANVAHFSRLASRQGITAVAFDSDAAVVDKTYIESRASGDTHLLPLVVDLTNPSSGVGWAGSERQSLQERGPADLVLALALVHHLAIGNNVPFPRLAEWIARIARNLVIEFVPKADSQVQRMLSTRTDVFDGYTPSAFEEAFARQFVIGAKESLPNSERVLYLMHRR